MRNRIATIAVALVASSTGCNRTPQPAAAPDRAAAAEPWFVDRAHEAGLDFTHVNGMSGQFYMPEILGPGVALFDYDNDGDLDVFVVQGGMLNSELGVKNSEFEIRNSEFRGRLFRNDLQVQPDGTRTLRFTDVTEASGLVTRGYGMGVAAGDVDNDGYVDLYVTKFGAPNQLFHNNGDGTFTDVSRRSGVDMTGWSVPAAFFDFDRDGWLDLYVGSYLRYTLEADTKCFSPVGARDYCTPHSYQALPGRLYRNRGDGTFVDVTASSRVGSEFGPALGVVSADFDGDGWIDFYVANDGKDNQLWLNQHNGTFRNAALLAGVAVPVDGKAEGSMGVDAGDFDNDGDEDLFMTELTGEGANLYVNDGTGTFEDRSRAAGIGAATMEFTGFGAAWVDVDNDGWLDLLTVNGTVQAIQSLAQARDPFPFRQRKQLFRSLRGERFEDVTARAGAVFALPEVSRGAAFGDIDNDGDIDVVIANNNGPVRLLVNQVGNRQHWIGLKLAGGRAGRDMLGARVEIVRADGLHLWRRSHTDGSYASARDPRVIAGLGSIAQPPRVRVIWPDGRSDEWREVPIDRYTTLKESGGP